MRARLGEYNHKRPQKGVNLVEEWQLVLYHHSTNGSQKLQSFGLALA